MTHPQRRPATVPELPKAPSTGHPARAERAEPAAKALQEPLVNFGGRIPESLRRRARFYAVEHEIDLQTILEEALTEYLVKREG